MKGPVDPRGLQGLFGILTMPEFRLQRCKVRDDRIVPTKEAAQTLTWPELKALLAPTGDKDEIRALGMLRLNGFVGRIQHSRTGAPVIFYLQNQDNSNKIGWLTKNDPGWPKRLQEVYRVEFIKWDGQLVEPTSSSEG